jgi:multidrug efflux system outer membrane protein
MIRKILLTSSVLCLAGCTVGTDYQAPSLDFANKWFSSKTEIVTPEAIHTQWWESFNDPMLNSYILQATENNKDLEIALANVRSARALRREQAAVFWPQINGDSSAERSKSTSTSNVTNSFESSFDASWELDIFGGNHRANEAAAARIGASQAKYQDVMLSTLSEVARTYYEARGLQKRIAITEQNTELLKETFQVIQDRVNIGETSEFDLSRAQSEYELTRARLPNLHAELRASIYSLSVLLGQPPEALLEEMKTIKPLPSPPDIVPVGLRSDILRRRPDIRVAERALAASIADIGAQTAELFPTFFLTGDIGSQAKLFGDLFSGGTGIWSLASAIQWSVFEGGAIRARIELKEAESVAALALYEKSVLEALRDAETALTRYGEELETRKRLAQGVQSLKKSTALAKELYSAGEEDYLAVVDAERQLIASEDDLIISETVSITKLIALYTALGGGWELPPSNLR